MLKNDRGVTLAILVTTIIVIIILAGTTITASDMIITSTKAKTVVTNMYLVSRKAESMYEEYQFNGTSEPYTGTKISDTTSLNSYFKDSYSQPTDSKWYSWDKSVLTSLGFDDEMLSDDAQFIVNYVDGQVIYTKGVKDTDGSTKYTLTDLTE